MNVEQEKKGVTEGEQVIFCKKILINIFIYIFLVVFSLGIK